MPPVILDLRALCWEQAAGAGTVGTRLLQHLWQPGNRSPPGEPVLPLTPNIWAELHVAAGAPERQLGNGCVSALLTFCCHMSACACASLVLPQQRLHQGEACLAGCGAGWQVGAGAGSRLQAAISQRQRRPGASVLKWCCHQGPYPQNDAFQVVAL